MDRKTENMIYNIGKSMLQENLGLAKMKPNFVPNAYTDPEAYAAWKRSQGVDDIGDANAPGTKMTRILGSGLAGVDGSDKVDGETWGPGDKIGTLGKSFPKASGTQTSTDTVENVPQEADHGLWDKLGGAWDGLGDKWSGLSTPEKAGVVGLVGAPLALGASYLAYKKMKENKKR